MTYKTVLETMRRRYQELAGFLPDPGSETGIRLQVLAEQLAELYGKTQEVKQQAFMDTASGEMLELHGKLRGIVRKDAVEAHGELTVFRETPAPAAISISEGTLLQTEESLRFETVETTILPEGGKEVTVVARALEGGSLGNLPAGCQWVFVSAVSGLTGAVNAKPFFGGMDRESDDALRQRLLDSYRQLPNGTNIGYYHQIAMGEEGVVSAHVIPRYKGRGTVKVVVAGQGCGVSSTCLASLRQRLEEEREVGVDVTVVSAEEKPAAVKIAIVPELESQFEAVSGQVRQMVADCLLTQTVAEPLRISKIYRALCQMDGLRNFLVSQPQADVLIQPDELIVAGEITVGRMEGGQ